MLKNRNDEEKRFYELEEEHTQDRSLKKERGRMWKRAAAIAASAMLFGTVAGASYQMSAVKDSSLNTVQASETETGTDANANENLIVSGQMNDVSAVAKKVMPSVVAITNKSTQEIKDYFYGTRTYEEESSGSGIIISKNDTELERTTM